jgi:hypothetical protein
MAEVRKDTRSFFHATTLYVVITDEARKSVAQHRPANVEFEEI